MMSLKALIPWIFNDSSNPKLEQETRVVQSFNCEGRRPSTNRARQLFRLETSRPYSPIMATTSSMFMYSLTLQPPTAITQAILGQFAGTREQQIVTASSSRITLYRPDPAQGKITTALSHDVFGIIRSLAAFRLAGSNKGKTPSIPVWIFI